MTKYDICTIVSPSVYLMTHYWCHATKHDNATNCVSRLTLIMWKTETTTAALQFRNGFEQRLCYVSTALRHCCATVSEQKSGLESLSTFLFPAARASTTVPTLWERILFYSTAQKNTDISLFVILEEHLVRVKKIKIFLALCQNKFQLLFFVKESCSVFSEQNIKQL
jgi:hypothetical protein